MIEFLTSAYVQHLLILGCILAILSLGFNICFGLGKLFNLAHIAAYAVGAYTTALLAVEKNIPWWQCLPASVFLSGLFALLLGAISTKLAQDYFAIGTIAFSSVVTAILINWRELTRGVLGIPGIPRPEISTFDMYDTLPFLIFVAIALALLLIPATVLFRSTFSRALRAQAESDLVAQSIGIRTPQVRLLSFVISSALAGFAGGLFSYYFSFIDPSSFAFSEMIFILTVAVVGRPGSLWGNVAATFFLVLLPEPLRFIEMDSSILGPMRQLLYAVLLFGVVFWRRKTIFPLERRV